MREVVVISGSATIEGRVEQDVVVVLGSATLGPNASVGGDLVVVSGSATIAPGATVGQDFVVIGGETHVPVVGVLEVNVRPADLLGALGGFFDALGDRVM